MNIEQLVGLGRATLQRLATNSDRMSALLQADTVLMLHSCSSLNDVLRPLSLSGDQGLRRGVAARADAAPARQVRSGGDSRLAPPLPGAAPQPDRSTGVPRSPRQTMPALPAGCDVAPSRQRVHNLLNRLRQELKDEDQRTATSSRTLPGDIIPVAEDMTELQPPNRQSGGSRKHRAVAVQGQTGSHPLPATASEGETTDWFDRHPRHQSTAAQLLSAEAEHTIPAATLRAWTSPLPAAKGRDKELAVAQETKKRGGVVAAPPRSPSPSRGQQPETDTAIARKQSRHFPADQAGPAPLSPLSQAETASPAVPPRATPASQLEQLVQRWQAGTPATQAQQTARDKQVGTVAPGEGSASGGYFPPAPVSSGERDDRNLFAAQSHSPIDQDHVFAETLERVLQREIRRHGIEEEQ